MDKKLLIDTIPFDISQDIIAESIKTSGPLIVAGVLQRIGVKNQNGRIYPEHVLKREAQKYAENFVKDRRAVGELDHPDCLTNTSEILTSNGWKFIKDITDTENVYTLNINTNEIELQSITKKIDQAYNGKMYHIKGKNLDVTATPNHRFLVNDRNGNFKFITSQEIFDLKRDINITHLSIPKTGNWIGIEKFEDTVILPPVEMESGAYINRDKQSKPLILNTKAFFAFLGFYLAEGWCSDRDRGYSVFLSQNDGEIVREFRNILKEMSSELDWNEYCIPRRDAVHVKFSIADARLWSYLQILGDKYTKYIPENIKNADASLLEELFEWFLNGDGTVVNDRGYDRTSVFSVSKKLVEDLQEVLLKIGVSSRIKVQLSDEDYMFAEHIIKVENKLPLYRLYIDKSVAIHIDFRFLTIEEIDFDDRVYCVQVPNQTFYCRNEGKCFWSGNSQVVNLKNVSHNIIEMHWEGDNLVGKVEILTTPSGNILRELLRCGVKLGISSRGLGTVKELAENTVEVQDDFELICFDMVSNPSTKGAFMYPQENINESAKPVMFNNKWEKVENIIRDVLTELNSQ